MSKIVVKYNKRKKELTKFLSLFFLKINIIVGEAYESGIKNITFV